MRSSSEVRAFLDDRHIELAARVRAFAQSDISPRPEPHDDDSARQEAAKIRQELSDLNADQDSTLLMVEAVQALTEIRAALLKGLGRNP